MDHDRQQHSQLFTVRVWPEHLGEGQVEWRGQVQQVISGEVYYFREWPRLIALLQQMLPESPDEAADPAERPAAR